MGRVFLPADVDEERARADEQMGRTWLDSKGRRPQGGGQVIAPRGPRHQSDPPVECSVEPSELPKRMISGK
jgi:hypothetical protein